MNGKIIVIRFLAFRKVNFINEHQELIKKNDYVWMLKTGKKIPSLTIESVIKEGGRLILKAPKKLGNKYYLAHFSDYKQGYPNIEMNYPRYYDTIPNDFDRDVLDGTWLKLDKIEELGDTYVNKLVLCSNGKKLIDVIEQTRTSVMYACES